jgi:hypothetical protein
MALVCELTVLTERPLVSDRISCIMLRVAGDILNVLRIKLMAQRKASALLHYAACVQAVL